MTDLRKEARGRMCQVRIPTICNFDPDTSVLAHIRRGSVAGMGQKPPDICAVIACSACHDAIDGRTEVRGLEDYFDTFILEALCRTLALWAREGFV